MIERLVFISTMVFFIMIGVNGFLMVGNLLLMPDGSKIGLFTEDISSDGLSYSSITNDVNQVAFNAGATNSTTVAPGSASSVPIIQYKQTQPAGVLGLNWAIEMVAGANLVGLRLAGLYPALAPIILIPVVIISALQAFFFMYWGMAGARAFLSRFL